MALRLRQGLAADRTSITPASGELIYTTDTKLVYVGDGSTAGGNIISGGGGGGGTTYSISSETATGGVNLRLTGSDASVDNVKFAEGSNITITRTDANTITIASAGGGGGGSFNSFNVSVDNSVSVVFNDADTLSVLGNNLTNVYWDEYNNLTIDTPNPVSVGTIGQLAMYNANGAQVSQSGPALTYDGGTGTLTTSRLSASSIETSSGNLSIFSKSGLNVTSFGGTLDGVNYSGRIFQLDLGPVDFFNPFSCTFRQTHNSAFVNAILLERSRGTFGAETAVQAGDVLHAIVFSGNDGTQQRQAATIAAVAEQTPTPGAVPGILAFQTLNGTGTMTTAASFDSAQYLNLSGHLRYSAQVVNTTTGNVTLNRGQVRGSWIFTAPGGSTRTLTLPAADQYTTGMRLAVFNTSASQSLNISYTGGGIIKTITPGTYADVISEGTIWFSLF